jgi:hypothetical protein
MAAQELKKCEDCYFADGSWCKKNKCVHATYGCRHHMTEEELRQKIKEEIRKQELEYESKMNFILTILVNCASATQIVMEQFDKMIVDKNAEKNWRQERKKAFNEIRCCAEKMRSLYERYIQPDIVGSMKTTEGKFDVTKYDDNQRDSHELVRLMLWHWEKCFQSYENVDKVFGFYESLPGAGIFSKEEIEKFKIQ